MGCWLKIQAKEDGTRNSACEVMPSKMRSSTTVTAWDWLPAESTRTTSVGYGVHSDNNISIVSGRLRPFDVWRLKIAGRAISGHSIFKMSRMTCIVTLLGMFVNDGPLAATVDAASGNPQYRSALAME